MIRLWRRWRTSAALDDAQDDAPTDEALVRVHRAMQRTVPWARPPVDLVPQTLWCLEHQPADVVPRRLAAPSPGWALSRAVARAAGLAVIALAALAAVHWARPTAPALPAGVAAAAHDAGPPRLGRLADAMRGSPLRTEARAIVIDAGRAVEAFRANLPRRPRWRPDRAPGADGSRG